MADLWGLTLTPTRPSKMALTEEPKEYPEYVRKFTTDQLFVLSYANVHCDSGKAANDLYLSVQSPRK